MKKAFWTIVERVSAGSRCLDGGSSMKRILLFVLAVALASCTQLPDTGKAIVEEPANSRPTTGQVVNEVDFCELLSRASEFHGQKIRVSAILVAGFESAFVYDPRCVASDRLVWFEVASEAVSEDLKPYFVPETEEFRAKGLNRVRGQFIGHFEIKQKEGFGHLNSANYRLIISGASDLRNVDPKTRYPW